MALTLGWFKVWAGVGNREEECRTPELVTAGLIHPGPEGGESLGNTVIVVAGTSVQGASLPRDSPSSPDPPPAFPIGQTDPMKLGWCGLHRSAAPGTEGRIEKDGEWSWGQAEAAWKGTKDLLRFLWSAGPALGPPHCLSTS